MRRSRIAEFRSRRALRCRARASRSRRLALRHDLLAGGLLGHSKGFQAGGFLAHRATLGLIIRHGLGAFPSALLLLLEARFGPVPGLLRIIRQSGLLVDHSLVSMARFEPQDTLPCDLPGG